ncbi:MAG: hypothetical protein DRH43_00785 [Deltaproteobacteria bacterium]|nr:MAG: hypothetical protein DRH43_00785 [Deltaproteobacteria bacterium]
MSNSTPAFPPKLEKRRRIDHLEGFRPSGPSLYRRVLVPVCIGGRTVPTWLYAGEAGQYSWRLLPDGVWSRSLIGRCLPFESDTWKIRFCP